jgi:hypothetical protein
MFAWFAMPGLVTAIFTLAVYQHFGFYLAGDCVLAGRPCARGRVSWV